jgi:L-asparagine oxygenase
MNSTGESPAPGTGPAQFEMTSDETGQVQEAVGRLSRKVNSSARSELYRLAPVTTRFLPVRLLDFLYSFRQREPAGAIVIRGWHIDDALIGPTPEHCITVAVFRSVTAL